MLLYLDEDVPLPVATVLRTAGHDVLTASEAGMARRRLGDAEQLAFALSVGRTLITMNRNDFSKLHRRTGPHSGIIVCSQRLTVTVLGRALTEAFDTYPSLAGQLLRISAGGIGLPEQRPNAKPPPSATK